MLIGPPDRVGGRLCLDLVNTVAPRRPREGRDYLPDYAAVLDWFQLEDVALPRSLSWLRRPSRVHPEAAAATHHQAIAFWRGQPPLVRHTDLREPRQGAAHYSRTARG